jgi:hypothetical protein
MAQSLRRPEVPNARATEGPAPAANESSRSRAIPSVEGPGSLAPEDGVGRASCYRSQSPPADGSVAEMFWPGGPRDPTDTYVRPSEAPRRSVV